MIWRPFTQEKTTPEAIKVVKGDGLYLYTEDGKKYADMISSWWVNIHGHANKEIADAISEQVHNLEQVIFTAFYHDPAEKLVNNLKTVLPQNLNMGNGIVFILFYIQEKPHHPPLLKPHHINFI